MDEKKSLRLHVYRALRRVGRRLDRYPSVRARALRHYLASHEPKKLHLGTGTAFLDGWLNTDIRPILPGVVFLDVRRPFPFADCALDYVFSEHMIEHLTYKEGLFMLRECCRVLRPGGKVRIATPNIEMLVGLFTKEKDDIQQRYIRYAIDNHLENVGIYHECFVVNNFFRNWGHRFIYDPVTLRRSVELSGFESVRRYPPGASEDVRLRGIESHGKVIGEDINRFETFVLEAECPVQD